MSIHNNHPYHLVEKSPWPILASNRALIITISFAYWFLTPRGLNFLLFRVLTLLLNSLQWWRDVWRERTLQGLHTLKVFKGITYGIVLFITSEVIFFFSFFWAFFNRRLNPTVEIGLIWPPTDVVSFNPFLIPLLNTAILLARGVTVTWAHHATLEINYSQIMQGLVLTVLLGVYFSFLQGLEYLEAPFTLRDSVYGSTFFVATGFHGFHVIIGTTLLAFCIFRLWVGHFTSEHHMGLEARIWYWHFVDVVWLFLYSFIYWWGY